MISKHQAIELLRRAGIANPVRLVQLTAQTVEALRLDLSGMVVVTEAASGPYVVTPIIAAIAGAAEVRAITADSRYASAAEVVAQTEAFQTLCGARNTVKIYTKRSIDIFRGADIVTNLGFVRPLDAEAIAAMPLGSMIALMCEAWEFRPGDIDLDFCRSRGIRVVATNEDYPGLDVFNYSGYLCAKLLLDAQLELHKCEVLIVGGDKFGSVICDCLRRLGVFAKLSSALCPSDLATVDAVVVADYSREGAIIGDAGDMTAAEVARARSSLTVIQFAGQVDVVGLEREGIFVHPGSALPAHRMAVTLAGLGPRPVAELHTAGFKVGELVIRGTEMKPGGYSGLAVPLEV